MNFTYTMRSILTTALLLLPASSALQADENCNCTTATLKGSYGFVLTGNIINVAQLAIVGIATYDGNGGWSRVETTSFNGNIIPSESVTGTYIVNPDCSGSTTDALGRTSKFVIVEHGEEIFSISTDTGTVATITAKKQFRGDGDKH
jgi:hypothetical protein